MLPDFKSNDYEGIKRELDQADALAEKTWLLNYFLTYGRDRVKSIRSHVEGAVNAFQPDSKTTNEKAKTRDEAKKMLDDANEIPILHDYPGEGKARRAFKELPGTDLQEMVSHPGAKNRKRAQTVLQALHDCRSEWIIGSD
jgi:hypothetical protein